MPPIVTNVIADRFAKTVTGMAPNPEKTKEFRGEFQNYDCEARNR